MVLSLVFVRSYNFGWSPVYDCKAYLETNTVKNCSYFGFGRYFLVSGTLAMNYRRMLLKTVQNIRAQFKFFYVYEIEQNCFTILVYFF